MDLSCSISEVTFTIALSIASGLLDLAIGSVHATISSGYNPFTPVSRNDFTISLMLASLSQRITSMPLGLMKSVTHYSMASQTRGKRVAI